MHNNSILEQNTLYGLSESAGVLYLKLLDQFQGDERRAFLVADRYDRAVGGTLDHILSHMPDAPDAETRKKLSVYFSERWRNNFMDEGKQDAYD
jgi:dsDNA-binding SOS-regulon protein